MRGSGSNGWMDRYTICDDFGMAERKGPGTEAQRATFMEEHTGLLERCCAIPSKERKEHIRELVAKAREHFGYSDKTIAQDILRPLLKAYARHVAERSNTVAPDLLLHSGTDQGRTSEGRSNEAPVRWDL